MTADPASPPAAGGDGGPAGDVELGPLGLDGGAHVLVRLALAGLAPGQRVTVRGEHPELRAQLAVWCRQQGHLWHPAGAAAGVDPGTDGPAGGSPGNQVGAVERGTAASARWWGAARAGDADPGHPGAVVAEPPAHWGLAARGAAVEPGGPEPAFRLDRRDEVWTERAAALYAQAAAGQWDPASAIDWTLPIGHGPEVEAAVVQVMTFLVENEEAALVVPARFLGQVHPHFREMQQVLAVTVADEARHIEVFTRRATMTGHPLALSTVGGRASLQTLLDEPDFATASFLLSVMGEGTFVSLLSFLERHAPDPLTRRIARLTRTDEARHVALSLAHLERHAAADPGLRGRLTRAAEARHRALQATAGLNEDVFDALVLLAAEHHREAASAGREHQERPGAADIAAGWRHVQALQTEMAEGRRARLTRLGFSADEAEVIAALHTRNFM